MNRRTLALGPMIAPFMEGFEARTSQDIMAGAVEGALEGAGRVIVEAGTGTGKSLAYLVPAGRHALREEVRIVVSTYTKALQRQLVEKDLPFLQKNVLPGLRYSLCIGGENYLCLRRLERTRSLFDGDDGEMGALLRWTTITEDGVRCGQSPALWSQVMREGDMCHGKDCSEFLRCWYQKARKRQQSSHILVTNHHLYFSNLSSGGHVLPSFGSAIFDEAHELEDVAADYLGAEVSNFSLEHLLNRLVGRRGRGLVMRLRWVEPSTHSYLVSMVESARLKGLEFFDVINQGLPPAGGTMRVRQKGFVEDTASEHLMRVSAELEGLAKQARDDGDKRELLAYAARCEAYAATIRALLAQEFEGRVYWAERSGRSIRLAATPVDVAGLRVFDNLSSAVFTSATLSTGGDFGYIKTRLGLEDAETIALKSHFDYFRQVCLYVGRDLPAPGSAAFDSAAIDRMVEIVRASGGGVLALFTSYRMLEAAHSRLQFEGIDSLKQGSDDSYRLVERFKAGEAPVMLGTYTFWQGIDVPGNALRTVIITKLPFAVPDEPVVEARLEHLKAQGRDGFMEYQVPRAALTLKQGFGRLIRRSTDRGVVAVLDPRLYTRRYGEYFLQSLPHTRKAESVKEAFNTPL